MLEVIEATDAPSAVGPFSQAIRFGNFVFISGQLPIVPQTSMFISDDAREQAKQCLHNIAAIAASAGTDISKTVKTTVLLTDLGHFAEINEIYATFFKPPYPARACFEVSALPKGARVEIEAVVALT